jgi:hypothetical protein
MPCKSFEAFARRKGFFVGENFMMKVNTGCLYFVDDSFFAKVNDPYLKINYDNTSRPHYMAFFDTKTSLYWLVPCSSKIDKYEKIIERKKKNRKPTDTIKIVKIQDKKTVLLFQDMFPTYAKYIKEQYVRGGQAVYIADTKMVSELEKTAKKIINLLKRGVRFTPTQPNIQAIEKIMQQEK